MFTGIIQEVGSVRDIKSIGAGVSLTVEGPRSAHALRVNDSVAINGVCQTVVRRGEEHFEVEAVEETLGKTTIGDLERGDQVNLELALSLGERVGGHLVQGHVDGIGVVIAIEPRVNSWMVTVRIPQNFLRYVVPVGSIAIDGISLTVAQVEGDTVAVSIIPHTIENTNLSRVRTGTRVNLEFDLIGKYVERLVNSGVRGGPPSSITMERLSQWGYHE